MFRMTGSVMVALVLGALAILTLPTRVDAHDHREVGPYSLTVGWVTEPAFVGHPNRLSVRIETAADDAMAGSHEHTSADAAASPDLTVHGALFIEALDPGASMSFVVGDDLIGQDVPFHDHLDHTMTGTIMVRDDAPGVATVTVRNTGAAFEPDMVMVRPGSAVQFINDSPTVRSVVSGMQDDHDHGSMVGVDGLDLQIEVTHAESGTSRTVALHDAFADPGHYVADMIPTVPGVYIFRVIGDVEGQALDETFESGPNTFSSIETVSDLQFPIAVPDARELESAARGAFDAALEAEDRAVAAEDDAAFARNVALAGLALGLAGIIAAAGSLTLVLRRR